MCEVVFKPKTIAVKEFHYTCIATFHDDSIKVIPRKTDSELNYEDFKKTVEEWNRQGNQMKNITTLGNINGYDYFITLGQDLVNKQQPTIRKTVYETLIY